MTEAQVKKYMSENRCFGCHEIGHRSGVCPTKHIDEEGKRSWGN